MAAAGGAAVAAVAVIALANRASDDAGAVAPPDTMAPSTPSGDDAGDHTITVSGHGTVSVVPDTAELSTGVQAQADTATAALDAVGTSSQDLIATLQGVGVAEDDIQTSGLSLWPVYDSNGRQITAYQASTSVTATIRAIDSVGTVVDALQGFVGDSLTINGISFSSDDPEVVLADARSGAIANARVRAEQYAEAAGAELGDIVRIVESSAATAIPVERVAAADTSAGVAIAPGSQDLAADVTVVFALQ